MKLLYLHGLESKLSKSKRKILENYGEVIAPELDYHKHPDTISRLYGEFKNEPIDHIIGSSMGGFAAFHLALLMNRCSLLFNPALARRTVPQRIPKVSIPLRPFFQIVLGGRDTTVPFKQTLAYLSKNLLNELPAHIHLRPRLAHRVPAALFEQEVDLFFKEK